MPAFGKTKEQLLAEMFPGKTEEQIKKMVDSFSAVEAKAAEVDGLKATVATSMTELAAVKAKLAEIENKPSTTTTTTTNTERPDWGEDADAAFQDRSKPLVALAIETRAEIIYDRVVRRLESDPYFNMLRREFDDLVKQEKNPAIRANEAFVENCYNVVFARRRHEILRDVRAGSGDYFVETGRNQNVGGIQPPPDTSKTLSEEEKREAAKFGLTPEKWLETRNKIKFVGGAIQTM